MTSTEPTSFQRPSIVSQPVCQRCLHPLQLDQDFEHLQRTELLTLLDASKAEEEVPAPLNLIPIRNSGASHPRYIIPPNPAFSSGYEVEDPLHILKSYSGPTSSLDHRLKVNACLFDVLSGRTELDHPLCQDCADTLLAAKQQCLEFQEDELKCLQLYLAHLDSSAAQIEAKLKSEQSTASDSSDRERGHDDANVTTSDHSALSFNFEKREGIPEVTSEESSMATTPAACVDEQNNKMTQDSQSVTLNANFEGVEDSHSESVSELEQVLLGLKMKLKELLFEDEKLENEIKHSTMELERRTEELDRATMQYNEQKQTLIEAEEEILTLESRLAYARNHLQRLQRTNILNLAFPIWYDGHIGVINGLHLGRLANRPVGWDEINAAWGQCALLLQCIGKKLNYTFQNYRIIPLGSQSKVVQFSSQKEYPLYYSTGGMRILSAGKFDTAMIAYLECLGQAQQTLEQSSNVHLPYRIKDRGKIQDPDGQIFSIRWNGNSEENWTKALKMMLINLKWMIAGLSVKRTKHQIATTSTPGASSSCDLPTSNQ